ncbi:MAG: mechanosensitive ion channel family protein [Desulfobacterales bacterium]|nr:mechanosensitive ion channel family protein [Desulfobacterales bacterium]MBS3754267.1 mechanosensitive ion channel family protein [Desulfobacterales bacterium]
MLLKIQILGNNLEQWLLALLVGAVLTGLILFVRNLITKRMSRLETREPDRYSGMFSEIVGRIKPYVLFIAALYPASLFLDLPLRAKAAVASAAFIALALQVGIWGNYIVSAGIRRYVAKKAEEEPVSESGVTVMSLMGRAILWVFIPLVILQNIGVNVTTLIASLGVAGIAIGLATQNILGDLFAALSILLDKPFEVGHFIIVGDHLGTVEKIGLKTTRIRSLSGELLIFVNNDLLQSRIRNFTHFQERRVAFTFGVRYDTPAGNLKKIMDMVQHINENTENTRFDRAHFKSFADFSLVFEVVYYVLSPDYRIYMDIQEKINMGIFEAFENEGIGFAFPTRTIHIASQPGQNRDQAPGGES